MGSYEVNSFNTLVTGQRYFLLFFKSVKSSKVNSFNTVVTGQCYFLLFFGSVKSSNFHFPQGVKKNTQLGHINLKDPWNWDNLEIEILSFCNLNWLPINWYLGTTNLFHLELTKNILEFWKVG